MSSTNQAAQNRDDDIVEQPGSTRTTNREVLTALGPLPQAVDSELRRMQGDPRDTWRVMVTEVTRTAERTMQDQQFRPGGMPADLTNATPMTPEERQPMPGPGAGRHVERPAHNPHRPTRGNSFAGVSKSRRYGRLDEKPNTIAVDNWREMARAKSREEAAREPCGNCGKPGHRVKDCVHPCLDGFVHGCPLCNAADHESADKCKQMYPTTLDKKLKWAIQSRAHRPPLAAFPSWMELYKEAKGQWNMLLPTAFPWTLMFPRLEMSRNKFPWETFDYTRNDGSTLPADPITANQDAIHANEAYLLGNHFNVMKGAKLFDSAPRVAAVEDLTLAGR